MAFDLALLLDDLISGLPTTSEDWKRRWALARDAALAHAPHLASGEPAEVRAEDLRLLHVVSDLHLFGARYRSVFDNNHRFDFAWQIISEPNAPDCRLEVFGDHPHDSHDAEAFLVLMCVAPAEVLARVNVGAPAPPRPPGAVDLLDALLRAMLRLMMQTAAVGVCDDEDQIMQLTADLLDRLALGP